MPANIKAFYDKLLAAGKRPVHAVGCSDAQLLHAGGMLRHDQEFDGKKFCNIL